jgi:hypothetical protein
MTEDRVGYALRAIRYIVAAALLAAVLPQAAQAQPAGPPNPSCSLPGPATPPANAIVLVRWEDGTYARLANTDSISADDLTTASLYTVTGSNAAMQYRAMDGVLAPILLSQCWQSNASQLRYAHVGQIRAQILGPNGHVWVRQSYDQHWTDVAPRYSVLVISRCVGFLCSPFGWLGQQIDSHSPNWQILQGSFPGETAFVNVTADQAGAHSSYDNSRNRMVDKSGRSVLLIPLPPSFDNALTVSKSGYLGCSEPSGDAARNDTPLKFWAVAPGSAQGELNCYMLPADLLWFLKRLSQS